MPSFFSFSTSTPMLAIGSPQLLYKNSFQMIPLYLQYQPPPISLAPLPLQYKPHHVTQLLQTFQWLSTVCEVLSGSGPHKQLPLSPFTSSHSPTHIHTDTRVCVHAHNAVTTQHYCVPWNIAQDLATPLHHIILFFISTLFQPLGKHAFTFNILLRLYSLCK